MDGLVVPGTYSAMTKSKSVIQVLKSELDKKSHTLSHMKINVRNVKNMNKVYF